ncbi:MAG: alpha/beta hydrolase domain-containing protein [Eubacteriales bacterium]|nr:alpha/beta hydrolase domain-containing protein [Eubacteriales bacterium]
MIKQIELIPETETSHPYARAAVKCKFEERGFLEEEYFLHGTANVYETRQGMLAVAAQGAPYVNRILIRRPKDPEKFSENVVVEILNATNYMDIDRVWVLVREKMMRDGDIYVGITSKPCTIPVMQKFDPARYAPLSWKNPRKPTRPDNELGVMAGASRGETEDGLFWDMLRELPGALRDQNLSPLKEFLPFHIYLAGWSQSGGYMLRFMESFAYRTEEEIRCPIYDGYFSTGAAAVGLPGLNQEESPWACAPDKEKPGFLQKAYQPFMEIHTETENVRLGNLALRREDSDAEDFKYRAYDIPGASHDTKDNMVDWYYLDPDLPSTGIFPNYSGKEPYPNDYPYNFIFHRCLNMLFTWAREGKKPPVIGRIPVDFAEHNATDENGNALGGWRTAFLEYPTCTYHIYSTPLKPDFAFGCTCFGYKEPFSQSELEQRYKSLENYRKLVSEMAKRQVQEGLLEPADEENYVDTAVRFAAEGGLR